MISTDGMAPTVTDWPINLDTGFAKIGDSGDVALIICGIRVLKITVDRDGLERLHEMLQ